MSARTDKTYLTTFEAELFVLTGKDRAAVIDKIGAVEALVAAQPRLADLAFTLSKSIGEKGPRLAIVAGAHDDLAKKLAYAREKLAGGVAKLADRSGIYYFDERLGEGSSPRSERGKVAFVFPGEGAQYVGMLKDLCMHFPEARESFDAADRACEMAGDGFIPSRNIYPPGGKYEGDESTLWTWEGAVEAVVSADTALMRIFERLKIKADAVIGHSIGEFMALEMSGILRFESDEDRIAYQRDGYLLIKAFAASENIAPGDLITVGGPERAVIDRIVAENPGKVEIALSNCPHQNVLCIDPSLTAKITEQLVAEGGIVSPLPFSRPYHTPKILPALDGVRNFFRTRKLHAPRMDAYSCMTADLFPQDPKQLEDLCVGQWAACVKFQEAIENMYSRGVRVFIEPGPRGSLTSFVDDILKSKPHIAVAANKHNRSGILQLHHALGLLAAHGVPMDLAYLYERRGCKDIGSGGEKAKRKVALWSQIPRFSAKGVKKTKRDTGFQPVNPVAETTGRMPVSHSQPRRTRVDPAVVSAYLDTMEQFLATQRELINGAVGIPRPTAEKVGTAVPAVRQTKQWPMLSEIVEHVPGQSLVALGKYDVDEMLFLTDHTLGTTEVSVQDPTLTAVPIIPLCMSLDILSEAACALFPGKVAVGLKDILATRWISFEEGTRVIRISAKKLADGAETQVRVDIRDGSAGDERSAFRPALVEGTVLLADAYPARPPAWAFTLRNERPCHWTGKQIYPERLFHGPKFQGTTSITRWGENGVQGTVTVLPKDKLFKSNPKPQFAADGIFIDSMGAALGLWGAYETFDGNVYLPFRVKEVRFYGPVMPAGTTFTLNLEIVRLENGCAAADITAVDGQGRMHLSIREFEDRIFPITSVLHRMFLMSVDTYLSVPVALPENPQLKKHKAVVCAYADVPLDLFESSHRVWQKMTSFLVLDRDERKEFKMLEGKDTRQTEWMLGRAVLKDAVRRFLLQHYGIRMGSPDIKIVLDDNGKPVATGPWSRKLVKPIEISLTHKGHRSMAIACEVESGGAGIDMEPVQAISEDVMRGAFSDHDREMIKRGGDAKEWAVRLWCAKEAVSKALGTGIKQDLRAMRVQDVNAATGAVSIALEGGWLNEAPQLKGKSISVSTARRLNDIVAACVLDYLG